jgi:glycosyltransferase involved in cell wall biosynthesis
MKILLYDDTPAYLVHGGKQVHAQKMYEHLNALGVDTEYARWWDPSQQCDLIHMFGFNPGMVMAARKHGVKTLLTHLVDVTSLSSSQRMYRSVRNWCIRSIPLRRLSSLFPWRLFPLVNGFVYLHHLDRDNAIKAYGIPEDRTYVIPNGCEQDEITLLQQGPRYIKSYLICLGSIISRKNVVLLAKAAKSVNVPVMFLGKPFNEDDSYYREFQELIDNKNVIYKGHVEGKEKDNYLKGASGFVLLSHQENDSIAVREAAAAGLPMLLPDLPWAHSYGNCGDVYYVNIKNNAVVANHLASFFERSKRLDHPTFQVMTWKEIAEAYVQVYQRVTLN